MCVCGCVFWYIDYVVCEYPHSISHWCPLFLTAYLKKKKYLQKKKTFKFQDSVMKVSAEGHPQTSINRMLKVLKCKMYKQTG